MRERQGKSPTVPPGSALVSGVLVLLCCAALGCGSETAQTGLLLDGAAERASSRGDDADGADATTGNDASLDVARDERSPADVMDGRGTADQRDLSTEAQAASVDASSGEVAGERRQDGPPVDKESDASLPADSAFMDMGVRETREWEADTTDAELRGVDAYSFAELGQRCLNRGELACAGPAQAQALICRDGLWQVLSTCGDQQRCDRTSGTCADVVPQCIGHLPGDGTCNPDGTLTICGPDLVTTSTAPCEGTCESGACHPPRCGDGKIDRSEECDDGNALIADGCEPDCTRTQLIQLVAGWTQTCALFKTGDVRCWGGNERGQLGLGTNADQSAAQPYQLGPIQLGSPAIALAAGYQHTCALMLDQSVQCWGRNDLGQLGLGHTRDVGDDELPTPATSGVPLGLGAKHIAAGGDTTCAILADDSLRCWGRNDFGQLGLGHTRTIGDDEQPSAASAQVTLDGTPAAVAVAGDHTCVLLGTHAVRCWGGNLRGELGLGNTDNVGDDELPTAASAITFVDKGAIVAITAGGSHTCIAKDSVVFGSDYKCWGYNGDGSLGVGYTSDEPLALADDWPPTAWGYPIVQLACGEKHTCVLLGSHQLRCIGMNDVAQLGLPNLLSVGASAPPNFGAPVDFGVDATGAVVYATLFATGAFHNCALLNTRQIRCWGLNSEGQLGLGFKSAEPNPFVGGTTDTAPRSLPTVQIFAPTSP